jgi:transcriptional regulator with XRE-family HTH domain
MQPWRRALAEAGLTMTEIAEATGKSVDTVHAYSRGARRPSPEWEADVIRLAHEKIASEAPAAEATA